jgi:hypothetical protein
MQRHRELDHSQASPKMSACDRNRADRLRPQLIRHLAELALGQLTQIVRGLDGVEKGCGQRFTRQASTRGQTKEIGA